MFTRFEPVFHYEEGLTKRVLALCAQHLDKSRAEILEDFGTFLVANPDNTVLRRLLRFSGADYETFLYSLEDLRGRARLAVPDLSLPEVELEELDGGEFEVFCRSQDTGFGYVLLGVLRAMADEYGALVMIDYKGKSGNADRIHVNLLDGDYSGGRDFDLTTGDVGQMDDGVKGSAA